MTNRDLWVAEDGVMSTRRALADRVGTSLGLDERETGLSFIGRGDRYQFFSYHPAIVRALLQHEYARVEWLYVAEGGKPAGRVSDPSEVAVHEEGVAVEGISVSLPLGTLTVKGSPRQRDAPSGVVSTPTDARSVAAEFGRGEAE